MRYAGALPRQPVRSQMRIAFRRILCDVIPSATPRPQDNDGMVPMRSCTRPWCVRSHNYCRGTHQGAALVHVVVRLVASVPGQLTADAQFANISWCWCWSQVGRRDQHQWQHQRGQQRFVVFEVSTIRLQAGRRESGVCPVCGVSRRCTTSVCSITWKDSYRSG